MKTRVSASGLRALPFPKCSSSCFIYECLGTGKCEVVCPEKFPKIIASDSKAEFAVSGEIEEGK